MKCRGMGAVTKKPNAMAKGKKVPGKVKKYNVGGSASAPREEFGRPIMEGVYQARANQAMKSGRRFAAGGPFPGDGPGMNIPLRNPGYSAARANQAMKSGRRMAKGKTVKRKMKGKKV